MILTFLQSKVLEEIQRHSKSYPITARYLAGELGLKKQRLGMEQANIRQIINALRYKGYPICAGAKGYYYARTHYELSNYIVKLENRRSKIDEALTGLNKSWDKVPKRPPTKESLSGSVREMTPDQAKLFTEKYL